MASQYPQQQPYQYQQPYGDGYDQDYYREPAPVRRPPVKKARSPARLIGKVVILVAIFIVFLFLLPQLVNMFQEPVKYYIEFPETAEFTVDRIITMDPRNSNYSYELRVPSPRNISTTTGEHVQWTDNFAVDVQGDTPTVTNPIMYGSRWKIVEMNSTGVSTNIRIRYKVSVTTMYWNLNSDMAGKVEDIPQDLKDQHLHDEWRMRPSDPEISELATKLTGDQRTVYDKAKAVYDYIIDTIEYGVTQGEPKDCVQTLKDRVGDCDDQAMLFNSLLRAAGIPAWLKLGGLYDRNTDSWGGHAWSEFYMPMDDGTGGTVICDPSNNEFLIRDCYRFTDWDSDGNGTHLRNYYFPLNMTGYPMVPSHQQVWKSVAYQEDGSLSIPVEGEGKQTPGFEAVTAIATMVVVSYVSIKRRKQ